MFQVRPLATVGAAALCLGVVLAGLGGGTAGAVSPGSLATTTTVSAVPTTQPYGVPGQEFVVNVTSSAAPTGTVAVSSGGQQLCTNLALNPVGSTDTSSAICVDTSDTLAVTASVIALYSPDTATFAPSKGKASGVVVAASTSASLSTSNPTGTWGAEQGIVFTGSVTNTQPGSTGTPTGTITVEQGAMVICTIQLPSGSGTGSCAPGPTGLAPGTDEAVTAIYDGDTNFSASAGVGAGDRDDRQGGSDRDRRRSDHGLRRRRARLDHHGLGAGHRTDPGHFGHQRTGRLRHHGHRGERGGCLPDHLLGRDAQLIGLCVHLRSGHPHHLPGHHHHLGQGLGVHGDGERRAPVLGEPPRNGRGQPRGHGCLLHPRPTGQRTLQLFGAGTHVPRRRDVPGDRELWGERRLRRLFGNRPACGGGLGHRLIQRKFWRGHFWQPRDDRGQRASGSSGGGTSATSGGAGSANGVTGAYQTPQQLLAIAAAGVAAQEAVRTGGPVRGGADPAGHERVLERPSTTSRTDRRWPTAQRAPSRARPTVRRQVPAFVWDPPMVVTPVVRGPVVNGTGNGSSSNPTTVNLVASQSKAASPAMTALLLGLLVLALAVMAVAAIRRNALRARALVTSAGDDEGAGVNADNSSSVTGPGTFITPAEAIPPNGMQGNT